MNIWSPKIEILNHFDYLINRVDIDIDECLENYKKEDTIVDYIRANKRKTNLTKLNVLEINTCIYQNDDISQIPTKVNDYLNNGEVVWEELTKTNVVDYLSQIREDTIDHLKQAQKDSLENLGSINLTINNDLSEEEKLDDLRRQLYEDRFYFQILFKSKWIFNLFTIVTDFYVSQSDIKLLEKIINAEKFEENLILDEKLVLMESIHMFFDENFNSTNLPNNLIFFRKNELKMNSISFTCDLNFISVNLIHSEILSDIEIIDLKLKKPETICIKDQTSLKHIRIAISSTQCLNFENLNELQSFDFSIDSRIDSSIHHVFDNITSIRTLKLTSSLSDFSIENLKMLKSIFLNGEFEADFNYGLFRNIGKQLTELRIFLENITNLELERIFKDCTFSSLEILGIGDTQITNLAEIHLVGFPILEEFYLDDNLKLMNIERNAFLHLKQLKKLVIKNNTRLASLNESQFIELNNLKILDLESNKLKYLNSKHFCGLKNLNNLSLKNNKLKFFDLSILNSLGQLEKLNLSGNSISNQEDIENILKQTKIEYNL